MSVRQYIGARYVTKIYENTLDPSSAEWQASVNYEPLTMVTYNNGSYLSKKQVPASVGNPADNPTYWAQTGFYNGQISYLQNEIDLINAKFNYIENRYFIFQGDSYAIPDNHSFRSWPQVVKDNLNLTSDNYEIWDNSGGGFVASGINGTFKDQLDNNIPSKTPSDIVICAGANDYTYTVSDIITYITNYCADVRIKYPNARIWISCIGWSTTTATNILIRNISYVGYKTGATENSCIWLDNPFYSLVFGNEMYDTIHPNEDGQKLIGYSVANALIYGNYDINIIRDIEITPEATFAPNSSIFVNMNQHNNMIDITLKDLLDNASGWRLSCSSMTISGWLKLGTLSSSILSTKPIRWIGYVLYYSDNYHETNCEFKIVDNELYVNVPLAISNVTELNFSNGYKTNTIK